MNSLIFLGDLIVSGLKDVLSNLSLVVICKKRAHLEKLYSCKFALKRIAAVVTNEITKLLQCR